MRQQLYDQQPGAEDRPFCDHQLAIVLDGCRLVVVEYSVLGDVESVDHDDFVLMVEKAAQRLDAGGR